jgi:hypothetical protein|tara:strand:- start:440 stop:601 length:162 start_codon:yes stop_codon:yes gene_type:complete
MVLYLESQLDTAYREYCMLQVKNDMPFVKREVFRVLYEKLMEQAFEGLDFEEE